jgi:hypothetical protein
MKVRAECSAAHAARTIGTVRRCDTARISAIGARQVSWNESGALWLADTRVQSIRVILGRLLIPSADFALPHTVRASEAKLRRASPATGPSANHPPSRMRNVRFFEQVPRRSRVGFAGWPSKLPKAFPLAKFPHFVRKRAAIRLRLRTGAAARPVSSA